MTRDHRSLTVCAHCLLTVYARRPPVVSDRCRPVPWRSRRAWRSWHHRPARRCRPPWPSSPRLRIPPARVPASTWTARAWSPRPAQLRPRARPVRQPWAPVRPSRSPGPGGAPHLWPGAPLPRSHQARSLRCSPAPRQSPRRPRRRPHRRPAKRRPTKPQHQAQGARHVRRPLHRRAETNSGGRRRPRRPYRLGHPRRPDRPGRPHPPDPPRRSGLPPLALLRRARCQRPEHARSRHHPGHPGPRRNSAGCSRARGPPLLPPRYQPRCRGHRLRWPRLARMPRHGCRHRRGLARRLRATANRYGRSRLAPRLSSVRLGTRRAWIQPCPHRSRRHLPAGARGHQPERRPDRCPGRGARRSLPRVGPRACAECWRPVLRSPGPRSRRARGRREPAASPEPVGQGAAWAACHRPRGRVTGNRLARGVRPGPAKSRPGRPTMVRSGPVKCSPGWRAKFQHGPVHWRPGRLRPGRLRPGRLRPGRLRPARPMNCRPGQMMTSRPTGPRHPRAPDRPDRPAPAHPHPCRRSPHQAR